MKRKLSMLLCAALAAGMLAGCGAGKPAESGDSQASTEQVTTEGATSSESPYQVRMVIALPAACPTQNEIDRVAAKINEITLDKLNMTLKLEVLPYATFNEQIPLELSAGADIDLLTAPTGNAQNWVTSGYLLDMTDLLEEYGQDIIDTYPDPEYAKAATMNGIIYGMPVHKEVCYQPTIFFRTDILEKYNIDVSNVNSLADVDAIFEEVAAKEPGMWMLAADNLGNAKTVVCDRAVGGTSFAGLMDITENTTVTNLLEADEFKEWCEYNHEWFEKGWINSGAASDNESYYSYIKSGQAFSFFSDYGHPLSETDQEKNCGGTDLTMVTMGEPFATTETAAVFSYAISAGSKDPAKAMQMLNLIETNTDMMNLLNWGVEGEDYIVNEDGLLDYPEGKDATTVGYHLGAGWILPNQFVCTPWVDDGPDVYTKVQEYNKTAVASKALGFNFNPEPVADQIAGITNVKNKYYKALIVGAVDPDEYLPKMIEEMNAAGMQEIIAESQRQLDEFLAAK